MKTITRDALIVASRQELIDTALSQAALIEKLQSEFQELKFKLEWFKRQIFGTKSERFIPSDDLQEALDLGIVKDDETSSEVPAKLITYEKKNKETPKPAHGRGNMPTHLPIKDSVIEPEGDLTGMVRIGEEISWYYEMDKPEYVIPIQDGVLIGELPALPVEKGNAGPGFIANILIDKYVYHLPLDRQRKKFKKEYDVDFSESWLCDNSRNGIFSMVMSKISFLQTIYRQMKHPFQFLQKIKKGKPTEATSGSIMIRSEKSLSLIITKAGPERAPMNFLKISKKHFRLTGTKDMVKLSSETNLNILHAWICAKTF